MRLRRLSSQLRPTVWLLRLGDLLGSHFLFACRCVEETARKIETRQAICLSLGLIRQAIAFFSSLAVFVGGGHERKPPLPTDEYYPSVRRRWQRLAAGPVV